MKKDYFENCFENYFGGDFEKWIVKMAVVEDLGLTAGRMKKDENGKYPIVFSVGGVELDFGKVAAMIGREVSRVIELEANALSMRKCSDIILEISELQKILAYQKNVLLR
ncbi:MAG: hypothetical protein NC393_14950 [Clostridium sp.]|nr:hypothetical protein [Clostridium sp.]